MHGGMNTRSLQRLEDDPDWYTADIASGIGPSERKCGCETCLRGLLVDGKRNGVKPMPPGSGVRTQFTADAECLGIDNTPIPA